MVFLEEPNDFAPHFSIVSCIFLVGHETLLLHRRADKSQGGKWGMPSGKVNDGETLTLAMQREIGEETGVIVPENEFTYFKKYFVNSSGKMFVYHLFYALFPQKPAININVEEHTEFKWLPLQQIFSEELVEDHPYCMRDFLSNYQGH